jgi:hypothetical protein
MRCRFPDEAGLRGVGPAAPGAAVARALLDHPSGATIMDDPDIVILNVAQARRLLTGGDLKSDIAFQNDVNQLLASLDFLWDVAESPPRGHG